MSEIPKPTFTPYQTLFYGCGTNYPHCKEDCYWYKEEQHMGAHIPYCQNKGENYIEPKDCENCEHYHSKYKKTNADRIRTMTDDQLAALLDRAQLDGYRFGAGLEMPKRYGAYDWLKWLKEEAKENAN